MKYFRVVSATALTLAAIGSVSGTALAARQSVYTITCENSRDCSCADGDDAVISGGVECALPPFSGPSAAAISNNHISLDDKGHAVGWTGECGWFSLVGELMDCNGVMTSDCYVAPAKLTVTCIKVR